ncbi:MAG: type II toxin-antitoxin system RelE/ParE family toxin [Muricoprocola sp.]
MANQYKVHITRYAYNQMKEIRRYIGEELLAPDAAKYLLMSIRDAIGKLQTMPSRHKLVDEEPWRTEGIRRLIVKNFYIYYWTDEQLAKVHVTAVVYGKRDQIQQLRLMNKDEM